MRNATATASIMIVEDDAAIRELLILALESNDFGVIAVGTINDALQQLSSEHVDLLLLDLKLGDENGIDLLRQVRQMPEYGRLPIILLTGCADRRVILQIAQLGVQGYVLKHQFSRKQLVERINQQLKDREAVRTVEIFPESRFSPAAAAASSPVQPPAVETDKQDLFGVVHPTSEDGPGGYPPAFVDAGSGPTELLRSIKPLLTRAQAIALVERCTELKARPAIVKQLAQAAADPNCSVEQVAELVKLDQALALKILKATNSVVYGAEHTIDAVKDAVLRLGVSQVRRLAASTAAADGAPTGGLGEHFNGEWFWEHSITTGQIAATIAQLRNSDKHTIDFAFTMGLLHDVARLVLVQQLDDVYKRVLNTAAYMQMPLEQVESRLLQVNHAEVAYRLRDQWNLPRRLVEAIALHHLPFEKLRRLPSRNIDDVVTLALADRLAHCLLLGSSGNHCQYPTEELVELLELKPDAIKLIEEQVPKQTAMAVDAAAKHNEQPAYADYRGWLIKKFSKSVRPLFISTRPEIDGYCTLFNRLRRTDDNGEPNIAVLHLRRLRDANSLVAILRERERGMRIERLPLIVISSLSRSAIDAAELQGREFRAMSSPFNILRLADTVNSLLALEGG